MELFHFSHDPSIRVFTPHVPRSNPTQPPLVWAVDEAHAPAYWFPRDCPRVTAWPRTVEERVAFENAFATTALRLHVVELDWLPKLSVVPLFRYRLPGGAFRRWPEASGYWIASESVEPLEVEAMPDLVECHVEAGIELRAVPDLRPARDAAIVGPWDFSIIRFANARMTL